MDSLANELISEIVKYVSLWDFKQLAPTCCRLNLVLHEDKLWQQFCKSYEVPVLGIDYIGAIRESITKEVKWKSENNYQTYGNGFSFFGLIFRSELTKLKPACEVKVFTVDTTFNFYFGVVDKKYEARYEVVHVDHNTLIINKKRKLKLRAGDIIKIEHNFMKHVIEVYCNDIYVTKVKNMILAEPCVLIPKIMLYKGYIEPF